MAEQTMMSVTGIPGGNGECWWLVVTEQEYRKVMGVDAYRKELAFRREQQQDGDEPDPWHLMPSDLIGNDGLKVELKIKVRRV